MSYFDLQVNGYAGADFCDAALTLEDFRRACDELAADGTRAILATLITDSLEALCAKLSRMASFRESDPVVRDMVAGFHVEGPFLNAAPGYIGAHPPEHVRPATPEDARRILDAGQGLVRIVTLAPENDAGLATTAYLASQGVTVSAGHCDPTLEQLSAAIDAGLSMMTHLGNGCPVDLPRHENIIQRALSLSDRLWFGYIPDGFHVPYFALKNYLAVSGLDRSFLVTDAITAAKLGPGTYQLSGAPVEIDAHGVARRPGSPNLAGSTVTLPQARRRLQAALGITDADFLALAARNPRLAIGWSPDALPPL